MPKGGLISPEQRDKYLVLRATYGPSEAARRTGIARSTGQLIFNEFAKGVEEQEAADPDPKTWDELDADAQRGVDDFLFFAEHYLSLWTAPWWLEVVDHLGGLSDTDKADTTEEDCRQVLLTVHPGAGKSTMLLAYILWRINRARCLGDLDFSATYGMRTERQAARGMRFMQGQMTANAKLIQAYGRYKPNAKDAGEHTWSRTQIVVAGMRPGKEATFIILGAGQSISGIRPFLSIWDDIVDEKNCGVEATEELMLWWDGTAEHRVEPGGVIAVCGVYWSPNDLLHKLAARMYVEADGSETHMWKQFKFRAHYEDRCPGDGTHPQYDPRTTGGCLLNPDRWGFRRIDMFRQANPENFAFQYQQEETSGTDVLVDKLWLYGGIDTTNNESFPGCVNRTRSLWELPKKYDFLCATLDPSPSKYAAAIAYAYDGNIKKTYVLDVHRAKMRPAEYVPFIREWTLRLRELDPRFNTWIIERSGAIYLVDTPEFQLLQTELGITMIFHETRVNKSHPDYGVWGALQPEFKHGRTDIPHRTAQDKERMQQFETELKTYPYSRTDDTVMSYWFFTLHRANVQAMLHGPIKKRGVPGWVQDMKPGPWTRR